MTDLSGKVALVTGASMGIGRQVTLDLARAGATVVGVARGAEALDSLALPIGSWTATCDVADETVVRALIESIEQRHGRLDVLVNNAGIEERRAALDLTAEDVWRHLRINLGGVVNTTLAALPLMLRGGGGRIVNMASAAGRSPLPYDAAYSTSKAAIVAFSESISYELEPRGVRVQVLFPGFVGDTRMARGATASGQALPPRAVRRTAEQVSRALLRGLSSNRFEINCARLETLAPIMRGIAPKMYRRSIRRTQPTPPPRAQQK